MAYPLEALKPTSTEEEQRAALQATIEQLVSEGKSPEEAQTTAASMLQQLIQPSSSTSAIPVQAATDYGLNVQNQRAKLARAGNNTGKTGAASNFQESYNEPRGKWNSPWNPSPPGPSRYVNR